jgi:hypothetical protein
MHSTISYNTFHFFPTYEAAAKLAAANQKFDDEAEYKVEEAKSGFFVVVYENGERVGPL